MASISMKIVEKNSLKNSGNYFDSDIGQDSDCK